MFDISTLAARDTMIVELEKTNGEPLLNPAGEPMTITIYGPASKRFQDAKASSNSAMMEHFRGKRKTYDQRIIDAELLARCTISFNNFAYGQNLSGYEMFKAFYLDAGIGYITEQVNKAIGDWENFIGESETT